MNEQKCTELVRIRAVSYDPSLHELTEFLPCESCGSWHRNLERHHRQFRSRGGLWVPSNVVLICRYCHLGATDEAPWVLSTGLNVHAYEEPDQVPVKLWYAGMVLLDDSGTYTPLDNA